MLDYIDKLNELDTEGVEPMTMYSLSATCSGRTLQPEGMTVTISLPMRRNKRTARSRFQRPYRESDQEDRKNGIIRINRP